MFMKLERNNMGRNTVGRNTGSAGGSPAHEREARVTLRTPVVVACRRAACGPSKRVTKSIQVVLLVTVSILVAGTSYVFAQQPSRDVSKQTARPVRDWVRDGVIYEIYP